MDTVTKSQRSDNMSRIRSKNTKPEMLIRKKLFQAGIRYRTHVKDLAGKPDIAIKKYKLIVDVKGCFWHGHEGCKYSNTPKSNQSYWVPKIQKNKQRDFDNYNILKEMGYTIFVIWECETKDKIQFIKKTNKIISLVEKLKIKKSEIA